ncbi:hypothetical protein JCM17380_13000 [Desulfosporosinus burensis]
MDIKEIFELIEVVKEYNGIQDENEGLMEIVQESTETTGGKIVGILWRLVKTADATINELYGQIDKIREENKRLIDGAPYKDKMKNGLKIAYKKEASCEKVLLLLNEGMTQEKIAVVLGVGRATVARRIKEAKSKGIWWKT